MARERSIDINTEHVTMKHTQRTKKNEHRQRRGETKIDTKIEYVKVHKKANK